jgi:hypothetical protein
MGGGSVTPSQVAIMSGQNGGRVLPGVSYRGQRVGISELHTGDPTGTENGTDFWGLRNMRFEVVLLTGGAGGWGGGPGETGSDGATGGLTPAQFASAPPSLIPLTATLDFASYACPFAGGGGGWGARGGNVLNTALAVVSAGGAGGKAINTNGHAVTWLVGANRAYGAVG